MEESLVTKVVDKILKLRKEDFRVVSSGEFWEISLKPIPLTSKDVLKLSYCRKFLEPPFQETMIRIDQISFTFFSDNGSRIKNKVEIGDSNYQRLHNYCQDVLSFAANEAFKEFMAL